ncbi:MAG TPA: GNAT family N-acetyltransferase [Acidimicrobiales bacterium]|nr:GNAT family N-acetyltransferase [Acidimicrobiales bacterium]
MRVEVKPVRSLLGRRKFVDLPFRLFGSDPIWVPPLRVAVHDRLSPKHPANEHQETQLWIAYREGRPVGRVGACIDSLFNEFQGESWAWIGFFESFDDPTIAAALFNEAWRWARKRGMTVAVGPGSFTTNDECGLLVDGFDHPPIILTSQNPPYYERLWTDAGWQPAMDLWGWQLLRENVSLSQRQHRVLNRIERNGDIKVRSMRMEEFDAEVHQFFELYNSAWARNWGFAPMTETEVKHLAKNLKQVIDPDLAILAETQSGTPVGVALALPDINTTVRQIRDGRLLPLGWLRLLRGTKKYPQARIFALGVHPDHQPRALGPLLYERLLDRLLAKSHIKWAEASWVLETNTAMNAAVESLGGLHYKTWRLYQYEL